MKSGIYIIHNRINDKAYIGKSGNVSERLREHLQMLEKGNHHSSKLQADYNRFGLGGFRFELLKNCPKNELSNQESLFMQKYNSIENGYNMISGKKTSEINTLDDCWRFNLLDVELNILKEVTIVASSYTDAFGYARNVGDSIGAVIYETIPLDTKQIEITASNSKITNTSNINTEEETKRVLAIAKEYMESTGKRLGRPRLIELANCTQYRAREVLLMLKQNETLKLSNDGFERKNRINSNSQI